MTLPEALCDFSNPSVRFSVEVSNSVEPPAVGQNVRQVQTPSVSVCNIETFIFRADATLLKRDTGREDLAAG